MELIELFGSQNLDLVSVGVAVAGIAILGFSVFLADKMSITSRTFFLFSIAIVIYAICNYLSAHSQDEITTLWLLRGTIFSATWASLLLFQFFLVYPQEKYIFPSWYLYFLLPFATFVSILTLTDYVFSDVLKLGLGGQAAIAEVAIAMPLFGITNGLLVLGSLLILINKLIKSQAGILRRQLVLVLTGSVITFTGILVFNVALPLLTLNTEYVVFAPIWFFAFIAATAYATLRYKLFDVKTISVSVLTFLLAITIIFQVIFSASVTERIFGASQFVFVLLFGYWLIQATTREVKQREKIEKLAADLEVANTRLKELDRQKTEFVSIASHQLRAPLTAIKGYASLLLERSYGDFPLALKDPLEKIAESSRLMINSIEDFLNISRIELGRMNYDMSDFDIVDLTKKVVGELGPVVMRKGLTLNFAQPAAATIVHADIGKIKQVITNFVDNAIKYTEKGTIDVRLETNHEKKKVRVVIKDTGVGMSKETIDNLFEKFTRARGASKINATGTGLGLFVAKQLVEGHKGRVWVESDGEGKGSTFYIELPT